MNLLNRKILYQDCEWQVIGFGKSGVITLKDPLSGEVRLITDEVKFEVLPTPHERKILEQEKKISEMRRKINFSLHEAIGIQDGPDMKEARLRLAEMQKQIDGHRKAAEKRKAELEKLEAELAALKTQGELENGKTK